MEPLALRTSELAATLLRGEARKGPGHSEHFLARTLRLEGPEQDRAMRLYHHSALLREVLCQQMKDHKEERAAIALGDPDDDKRPCAHVIVTRRGIFVTCLSASMSVGDAALLSYQPLQEAMDRTDAQQQAALRRKKQLPLLSAEALAEALSAGPGHVHREMVEILEMEPQTYLIAVSRAFFRALAQAGRYEEMRAKYGLQPEIWKKLCRLEGTVTLCFYLFGAMDETLITEMLCIYLDHDGPNLNDVAVSLSRHKGGARPLLEICQKTSSTPVRRACYGGALLHALRHPKAMPDLLSELRKVPPPSDAARTRAMLSLLDELWGVNREAPQAPRFIDREAPQAPRFIDREAPQAPRFIDPRQIEIFLSRGVRAMLPLLPEVADPTWLLTADEHREHAVRRLPVSAMFPRKEIAPGVKAAWDRFVRTTQMPVEPREYKRPVVRSEPRVGRNDPCPCKSQKKYKHCCAGKQPEKPAAAKEDGPRLPEKPAPERG